MVGQIPKSYKSVQHKDQTDIDQLIEDSLAGSQVSLECRDMIVQCLKIDIRKRIGSQGIKNHVFMGGAGLSGSADSSLGP